MAIPTKYDGIEYRSRLEARWAAFMRNIGWDIVYEPFDGDGYIPDFLVQGDRPFLVEVKPATTASEYQAAIPKAESGLRNHWTHDILIVGAAPIAYSAGALLHAGWIGYGITPGNPAYTIGEPQQQMEWCWGTADWLRCFTCAAIRVRTTYYTWRPQPCSHDHKATHYATRRAIEEPWADACNDVKWRGRAA